MSTIHKGSCFCGAVELEAKGCPVEMGFCHCRDCRSYSGAPFVAFTLWPDDAIVVTRGAEQMGSMNRTGATDRRFCTLCGGHLLSYHPGFGFTDVLAGVLPSVKFQPSLHLHYAHAVLQQHDSLPKLRDFPAHAGGSGELVSE
jgi:hypothetical protein